MTLYEFNLLSKKEQYEIVFNTADFIDSIKEGDLSYILYSMDMFFIQITYRHSSNNVCDIKSFITGQLLDRFSVNDLKI